MRKLKKLKHLKLKIKKPKKVESPHVAAYDGIPWLHSGKD